MMPFPSQTQNHLTVQPAAANSILSEHVPILSADNPFVNKHQLSELLVPLLCDNPSQVKKVPVVNKALTISSHSLHREAFLEELLMVASSTEESLMVESSMELSSMGNLCLHRHL